MTDINEFVNIFINKIKENDFFADKKVIFAYPNYVKPTILKKAVIAVGIASADMKPVSLGQNYAGGILKIFADIYIPYNGESKTNAEIISKLSETVSDLNAVGICVYNEEVRSSAQCVSQMVLFSFSDEFSYQ
ncbi:MAG: hypothetical protein LIO43_04385 [Clostridiales bacterium]|nr:hypothetical protein [Clostridiales bacterium]